MRADGGRRDAQRQIPDDRALPALLAGICLSEALCRKRCIWAGPRCVFLARRLSCDDVKNPSWQDWIITKEKGGGALFDQHIHDIDAVRWLFGAPEAVSVCARTVFPKSANDIVSAAYHYGDKVVTALDDITYKGVPFLLWL